MVLSGGTCSIRFGQTWLGLPSTGPPVLKTPGQRLVPLHTPPVTVDSALFPRMAQAPAAYLAGVRIVLAVVLLVVSTVVVVLILVGVGGRLMMR